MSRAGWGNAALLAATVLAVVALARRPQPDAPAMAAVPRAAPSRPPVALPGGGQGLPDVTGHLVPLRAYRRIVSTSILTDRLLVELCEPDRIAAFSADGVRASPWSYQYAGKPSVAGLTALEPLMALHADLVLLSSFGAPGRVEKLRAAGVQVFDLGDMRGVATLGPISRAVATLIGHPERGERFVAAFEQRLARVAAGLGDRHRYTALYLATIGPALYGGTVGTSYHDVIEAAGLVDAAAGRFSDWPSYSAEQLIGLAPERVITKSGMGQAVCRYPGLDRLPACGTPGGVIELPAGLLDEPGPAMLDAAELLFSRAYGR